MSRAKAQIRQEYKKLCVFAPWREIKLRACKHIEIQQKTGGKRSQEKTQAPETRMVSDAFGRKIGRFYRSITRTSAPNFCISI